MRADNFDLHTLRTGHHEPELRAEEVGFTTHEFRLVGHGPSLRVECRVPGGDVNPYLALAGLVAAALSRVPEASGAAGQLAELPPPVTGNAYTLTELPRVPATLDEALALWESSALAAEAFGADVVRHVDQLEPLLLVERHREAAEPVHREPALLAHPERHAPR